VAVRLSFHKGCFIADPFLPIKAIDLSDKACALLSNGD
jgi:ATP-dependent Clp protease ATP-binding subunit ClpA